MTTTDGRTPTGASDAPVVPCLGVPIAAHTPESAARRVVHRARRIREARNAHRTTVADAGAVAWRGSDVHLCNAYTLALADRDPALLGTLRSAFLNLADGQSVVWANRFLHRGVLLPRRRVYGPDLMLDVFALSQDTGLRHYLLGSTPEVLAALQHELRRRFPRAVLAGGCSPPFRSLTEQELLEQEEDIRSSGADIVWVGLGTPLQDQRAAELATALPVMTIAVGAAFDFIAGNKRQAPTWMQRGGLEWLFRLACEPRRLWRRYLLGNTRFVGGVVRQAALGTAPARPAALVRPSAVEAALADKRVEPRPAAARPLRIVLAAYACDPSRGTGPGMGWAWAEALARRGHTVELLTRPHGDNTRHITRRIEDLGAVGQRIRTHVVSAPTRPWWISLLPGLLRGQALEFVQYDGWQRRALEHARRGGLGDADLVHHVSYGSLVGGSVLRMLGPPLVFGPVGGGQTPPRSHRRWLGTAYLNERVRELLWVRGMSLRPACRATLRDAALVLTTNRDTARLTRRLGRADPLMVLSDGVPDELLKGPQQEPGRRPGHPPTVLWIGRLTAIKAPELALRAFALLLADIPDARLEVLGDGPLRPHLERLTARLGAAGSVRFRGRLPWTEALGAYDHADVLLFTSLRDSFGVQNLEAWARGLPVVHLDHQGVGDFSAPGCATPVPLGDPADLPGRLARALAGVLGDEEARRRMSGAGLRWARRHTWTSKAELAERLYEAVLNPLDAPAVSPSAPESGPRP